LAGLTKSVTLSGTFPEGLVVPAEGDQQFLPGLEQQFEVFLAVIGLPAGQEGAGTTRSSGAAAAPSRRR